MHGLVTVSLIPGNTLFVQCISLLKPTTGRPLRVVVVSHHNFPPTLLPLQLTKAHFTGASNASEGEGSLTLSSSVLLRKMRSRNALSLPETGSGLHTSGNSELLRELRSFVATQAGRPGKATTKEILGKFGGDRLSPADSVVFRSMLHQICDFERYHGDGLWSLKADYR